ncbi:Arc family DNA-binding protein [Haloferula sp. BvORR071]|uniref:FitA-like ribbon-helix-helix domain-containing protein n=1 Tax=Haloferula sp. BvORR071 TaxID=1396141 RepID=UPI000551F8F5|nr:Arc family DNA-binding protein [Haloferula sp. BvORR071]
MNLTIKGIPEELGAALKELAAASNRSLNGEIIHRLSRSLAADAPAPLPSPRLNESPDAVADAWESLAGRWKSDLNVEAEIAALYETRSGGREIDLTW